MQKFLSVIVPVYNVGKYLKQCADSSLSQQISELELILVDDGSTDNCGELCDALAAREDRVCVIHKSNGGLADARNAGLDAASGEYVAFLDGDDFYAEDALARATDVLARERPDLLL
ncbi:MAG: glycosyltransferase, partial [Oscillospiraceae bacterium]